jgi:hypothetical protein
MQLPAFSGRRLAGAAARACAAAPWGNHHDVFRYTRRFDPRLRTLAMLRHMISRGQAPGAPRPVVTGMARQCYVLMAGFGLSVALFFVTTGAWLLWVIVPLLAGQVNRLRRRDGRGPGRAAS